MHINACKRACLYAGVTAVGVRGWHYALQQRICESFNPQVVLLRVAGRRAHAHAMATLLLLAVKHPGDRGRVLRARVSLCFTRLHTQLVRCRALTFGSTVNTCNRQWTARPLTASRTCRTGFPPPVRVVVYQWYRFQYTSSSCCHCCWPSSHMSIVMVLSVHNIGHENAGAPEVPWCARIGCMPPFLREVGVLSVHGACIQAGGGLWTVICLPAMLVCMRCG